MNEREVLDAVEAEVQDELKKHPAEVSVSEILHNLREAESLDYAYIIAQMLNVQYDANRMFHNKNFLESQDVLNVFGMARTMFPKTDSQMKGTPTATSRARATVQTRN